MPAGAARGAERYSLLELDGLHVKWGKPQLGSGATIRYAVAGGASDAAGTRNCRRIAGVAGLLKHSAIARKQFDGELAAAMRMWEDAADIRFVPVRDAKAAQLVVAAEARPDGWAYTDVTPHKTAPGPTAKLDKAIICLNPALTWLTGMAAPGAAQPAGLGRDVFRLRYVLAHELGHALGLDHPDPSGEIMSFLYDASLRGLQAGDIAGAVALYGAPLPAPALAGKSVAAIASLRPAGAIPTPQRGTSLR